MTTFLLDVNVLIALFWPPQQSHERARIGSESTPAKAGPLVQSPSLGEIRIISNARISPNSPSPLEAEEILSLALDKPNHQFWPDELSVRDAIAPFKRNIVGHRQITDAYLFGLTIFRKGKLATLDGGIGSLIPERERRAKYIEQL